MSSRNVLGGLFWKLPEKIRDIVFGGELPDLIMGIPQVKFKEILMGRKIYEIYFVIFIILITIPFAVELCHITPLYTCIGCFFE